MPSTSVNLETRIGALSSVLTGHAEPRAVERELQAARAIGRSRGTG
jgi:hypothetical protein